MGKQQFLVVFGGILFGFSASFYLQSFVRLIREKSFFKEKLFVTYAFGFFVFTLIDWYVTYDMVQYIDHSIVHYLLTFVEIGILFIISGMINPDTNQHPSWEYLKTRTGNILAVTTLGHCWGLLIPLIFEGIPYIIHPAISLVPVIFLILHLVLKKPIISHIFVIYVYVLDIYLIYILM